MKKIPCVGARIANKCVQYGCKFYNTCKYTSEDWTEEDNEDEL